MTKEERKEYRRHYYLKNREKALEQRKQYRQEHKDEINDYKKQYNKTPMFRANSLSYTYRRDDKKYNRGESTITSKWIVKNIFSQPCHYCGETDWHLLGCDRIDNSKPHTMDNVVPCCCKCNRKKGTMSYEDFLKEIKTL